MSITQAAWIIGIVVVTGLLAVIACRRSSQISRAEEAEEAYRTVCREDARLRAKASYSSIMEALRDE